MKNIWDPCLVQTQKSFHPLQMSRTAFVFFLLQNTNPFSFGGPPRVLTKGQGFITLSKLNSFSIKCGRGMSTKMSKLNIFRITESVKHMTRVIIQEANRPIYILFLKIIIFQRMNEDYSEWLSPEYFQQKKTIRISPQDFGTIWTFQFRLWKYWRWEEASPVGAAGTQKL